MYRSPIEIKLDDIVSNVVEKTDEYMVRCVQQVGVDVDKDELVKALEYDRKQYEKGYADGRTDVTKHGHWVIEPGDTVMHCNSCGWAYKYYGGLEEEWNYCPHCGSQMDEVLNIPLRNGKSMMELEKFVGKVKE